MTVNSKTKAMFSAALLFGSALVILAGTWEFWSAVLGKNALFFGLSQTPESTEHIGVIAENVLLNAQFLLFCTALLFIVVFVAGRISAISLFGVFASAYIINEYTEHLYFFVEYVLPLVYVTLLVASVPSFFFWRRLATPSRIIALGVSAASVLILVVFHYVLITGLQNNVKAQSRALLEKAVMLPLSSLAETCNTLGIECHSARNPDEIASADKHVQPVLRDMSSGSGVSTVIISFDAAKQSKTNLPAGKDEVFAAIRRTESGVTYAIDWHYYPLLREKIVFYISALTVIANLAWLCIGTSLMFYHQIAADRRRKDKVPCVSR